MKYVKILGLLAVAAAALMAFAGTASATKITSPEGTKYFGEIHAESEGHAILHPSSGFLPDVECNSTVTGKVEVNDPHNGAPTTNASGKITTLDWTNCTDGYHATTVLGGTLSINSANELRSTEATVEVTRFGISCRYLTNNTKIGTVTDSTEGSNKMATLHIEANIPWHNGSGLCGTGESQWTGSYTVTKPTVLHID